MPMPQANTPYFTDDQWQQQRQQLGGLADLTGQEQQIAQQQALAQQLRGGGGTRMDTASQIGRGLGGIGSAMMNYKAMQGQKQLGADRKRYVDMLMQQGGGGQQPIDPSAYQQG